MKNNMYALLVATLFVGFGLNGSDTLQGNLSGEETNAEITLQGNNQPLGQGIQINSGNLQENNENTISDEIKPGNNSAISSLQDEIQPNNSDNLEDIKNTPQQSNQDTKQQSLIKDRRVQVAFAAGGLFGMYYYRDSIGKGVIYTAKGVTSTAKRICSGVGSAAVWLGSFFKSKPKAEESQVDKSEKN